MTVLVPNKYSFSPDDNGMPELLTNRVRLRAPKPCDLKTAVAFFMSQRSTTVGGPHSYGSAWRIFATICGHWQIFGYGLFAVTSATDDKLLGLVGPWTPGDWPETEVGWIITDPKVEGTGIATEAASAAIWFAYTHLGWKTVVHYIRTDNTRLIRLAEKLGGVLDPNAPQPEGKPCHIYRQPKPEAIT